MPNLPSLKPKEIARLLEKSGFILKHTTGSHYTYYKKGIRRPVSLPFHTKNLHWYTACNHKTSPTDARRSIEASEKVT